MVLKSIIVLLCMWFLLYVFMNVDPTIVVLTIEEVGLVGICGILGVYFFIFLIDSLSWYLTILKLPLTLTWFIRLWKVRIVSEAFNMILPGGSIGGEPVKVLLMQKYNLKPGEIITSIILAKTINLVTLVFFLIIGFWIILLHSLPVSLMITASVGLSSLGIATFCLLSMQRLQILSKISRVLLQTLIGVYIKKIMPYIADIDHRLIDFYTAKIPRFLLVLMLSMSNWVLSAFQVYVSVYFLGASINFSDAWLIESIVQTARAAAFLVPASLGIQEGAFVTTFLVLGFPESIAVAVALLKRGQEVIWILSGLLLSLFLPVRRKEMFHILTSVNSRFNRKQPT